MELDKHDPKYWLQKVRDELIELKNVPESMRTESVCIAAMRNDGWDLKYVPKDVLTVNICRAAVRQNAYVIEIIPPKMRAEVRAAMGIGE